jgi:rRNA-processing protein FCF1
MEILLDTNALMLPAQKKVDIYRMEGTLITLENCMKELEKLAENRGKAGAYARVALELAKKNVHVIPSAARSTDKAIVAYAAAENCAVATNDAALIKSLKSHNIKVIRLKQGKFLVPE